MWKALGACYALLQRDREAIKWYKRAAECDPDGKHRIMIQLARTYDKLGENNVAADYYRRALDRYVEENVNLLKGEGKRGEGRKESVVIIIVIMRYLPEVEKLRY